jgi:TonB family protein
MLGAVDRFARQPDSADSDTSSVDTISVTILTVHRKTFGYALPRPLLMSPTLRVPTLTQIVFEEPEPDDVPGIIGATSAPHPFGLPAALSALHAARAGLLAGESITVVLSVEVLPDGSVGQVSVQSSSGNPSADLEALALARDMRWVPGTLRRHAVSMRVQYSMTLTG